MAIENLSVIEKTLQLPEGTLSKAIESTDSVNVELPELEVFKKDEYNARIENLKGTFQKQGQDFFLKDAKEKLGLEFEGKTLDKFAEAFQNKILKDAKIEPELKVKELSTDLEKLRANLAEKDSMIANIENSYKQKEQKRFIKDTLLSKINIETSIPKEDVLTILQSKYEIDIENDSLIFKQNGEVLKNDKTLNPLGIDDVFNSFLPTYAKEPTGGKGGSDKAGNHKAGSLDAFIAEMQKQGITMSSTEFNLEMSKRISNKTLTL